MNEVPPWVLKIENEAGGKRVLIVEGDDDRPIVEKWLEIQDGNFRSKLYVHEANGRDKV